MFDKLRVKYHICKERNLIVMSASYQYDENTVVTTMRYQYMEDELLKRLDTGELLLDIIDEKPLIKQLEEMVNKRDEKIVK